MGQTGPVDVRNLCPLYTEVRQLKSLVEWDVGGPRNLRPQGFVPTASQRTWTEVGASRHAVIPVKYVGYLLYVPPAVTLNRNSSL
jgi:hypothetical protein